MKNKKYVWSMLWVYLGCFIYGIQISVINQEHLKILFDWKTTMCLPKYSLLYRKVMTTIQESAISVGIMTCLFVWIGGEISERMGRKIILLISSFLYVTFFYIVFYLDNCSLLNVSGIMISMANGFLVGSGFPVLQETCKETPGASLMGVSIFVWLSNILYPILTNKMEIMGFHKFYTDFPIALSLIYFVLLLISPFLYDQERKMCRKQKNEKGQSEKEKKDVIPPGIFVKILVMVYAFFSIAMLYAGLQYTLQFGVEECGLSRIHAIRMAAVYSAGTISEAFFNVILMKSLKWNPLKVCMLNSLMTVIAFITVMMVHWEKAVFQSVAFLGLFVSGGALQTGLGVAQEFTLWSKGRTVGVYYFFAGIAMYVIPKIVFSLQTKTITIMLLLLGIAIIDVIICIYLFYQYERMYGEKVDKEI